MRVCKLYVVMSIKSSFKITTKKKNYGKISKNLLVRKDIRGLVRKADLIIHPDSLNFLAYAHMLLLKKL